MAREAPIFWWNQPGTEGHKFGQINRTEGRPIIKPGSASPYASSSFKPYTPRQEAPVAQQQAQQAQAPAGLLGAGGSGLLNAAQMIGKASGPTATPVSLGSMIGPALAQFGEGVAADRKAQEAKAREQALIAKYGPEAMVPGAIGAIIKANADKTALNLKNKQIRQLFGGNGPQGPATQGPATQGPPTPGVNATAPKNLAAPKSVPKFNEEEKSVILFAKNPGEGIKAVYNNRRDQYKLAVTRVKPARTSIMVAQTGIGKVRASVKMKNATADIAAVNAYQRLIDPGVVKGEDVRLQAGALSLGGVLSQWLEKRKTGEILPDHVRQRMLQMAEELGNAVIKVNREEVAGQKDRFDMSPQLDWRRVWPKRWDALLVEKRTYPLGTKIDPGPDGEIDIKIGNVT